MPPKRVKPGALEQAYKEAKAQAPRRTTRPTVPSVTDVAYRPATVEELDKSLTNRKQELQTLHEEYKQAKVALREAVLKYRRTDDATDKAEVVRLTRDISRGYFSQDNVLNFIHKVNYNPSSNLNSIKSIPTYGYLVRDLLFEHHRSGKVPEDVGILTYPIAYPAEWFFKQKVEAPAQPASAVLGADVGPEGRQGQLGQLGGGSDEPKKQLSSRQIGAIIAARKAGRF